MRKMNLPENKYDGVWVCTSILNLKKKDLPLALSEFKRVLKSHGKLFISVKKGSGERIIPDKFGKRFFSFYSLNELKELVSKSGFKITYTEVVPDAELAVKDPKEPKPDLICLYAEK
jgi:ubiquinone/menaquinone biosynthesis C-methylase UbiE